MVLWARLTRDATVDDAEADRAVVYFGESIRSGYVLTKRDHRVNVTSLEAEPWKRAHPEVCRRPGRRSLVPRAPLR